MRNNGRGGMRLGGLAGVLLVGVLAGGLAACTGKPFPAAGPTRFDGIYAGRAVAVGFSDPDWKCDWNLPPIEVYRRQFRAEIDGAPMTVNIGPDGHFDNYAARPIYAATKEMTPIHITGQVADGELDATVTQPRCTFKVTMHRTGPASVPPGTLS